jgi:hypothetical protein
MTEGVFARTALHSVYVPFLQRQLLIAGSAGGSQDLLDFALLVADKAPIPHVGQRIAIPLQYFERRLRRGKGFGVEFGVGNLLAW